jgi:shikimate kinase
VARRVVLVCGPPGGGKTTLAHTLGLPVYDVDDPEWIGDEAGFRRHIAHLAADQSARAVVIRAGATLTARARAEQLIGATETIVLATPAETCIARVIDRGRTFPPMHQQIAAVHTWHDRYEPPDTTTAGVDASSEAW